MLILLGKRFKVDAKLFYITATTAELEALKAELVKARQEAEQQKVAASKAEGELAAEKVARGRTRHGSWKWRRP